MAHRRAPGVTALQRGRPVCECAQPDMSALVSLAEIEAAAARIRPVARVTPLIEVPWPGGPRSAGAQDSGPALRARSLLLKCENLQPMGAFKIRGAYNMIAQLSCDELQRG